jgi:hypothetical protein
MNTGERVWIRDGRNAAGGELFASHQKGIKGSSDRLSF